MPVRAVIFPQSDPVSGGRGTACPSFFDDKMYVFRFTEHIDGFLCAEAPVKPDDHVRTYSGGKICFRGGQVNIQNFKPCLAEAFKGFVQSGRIGELRVYIKLPAGGGKDGGPRYRGVLR